MKKLIFLAMLVLGMGMAKAQTFDFSCAPVIPEQTTENTLPGNLLTYFTSGATEFFYMDEYYTFTHTHENYSRGMRLTVNLTSNTSGRSETYYLIHGGAPSAGWHIESELAVPGQTTNGSVRSKGYLLDHIEQLAQ